MSILSHINHRFITQSDIFKNLLRTKTGNELSHFKFSTFENFKSPITQKPAVNVFYFSNTQNEKEVERQAQQMGTQNQKQIKNSVSIELQELKKANSKTGENLEQEYEKSKVEEQKKERHKVESEIFLSKMNNPASK